MSDSASSITRSALLEHASFVRALARRLVRDACEAEDLEQDAWLAALSRDSLPAVDPRGWLARVLRTRAGNRRRSERRRRDRERAATPGKRQGPVGADELVERMEVRQRVVAAVLALEEPYRETVLLRFDRELTPSAIARETGIPLDTIKTRLRRALELLRERLDREAGGDGRSWLSALVPLLDGEPSGVAPAAPLLSTTAVIAVVGAVSLAVLAAAWGWKGFGGAEPQELPASPPPGELVGEAEPEEASIEQVADARGPVASTASGGERRELVLRVVDVFTREPVAGAEVLYTESLSAFPEGGEIEDLLPSIGRRRTSDANGEVRIPVTDEQVGVLVRKGDRGATRWLYPDDLGPFELGIYLRRSLSVQVRDSEGQPASGVPVSLGISGRHWGIGGRGYEVITAGDHGIATFHGVEELLAFGVPGLGWPLRTHLESKARSPSVELDPEHLPDEPVVLTLPPSGRVVCNLVDEEGNPHHGVVLVRLQGKSSLHFHFDEETVVAGPSVSWQVDPGLQLTASARLLDAPRDSRGPEIELTGPERAGELVTVTIPVRGPAPRLTGILADEEGSPLAAQELEFRLYAQKGERRRITNRVPSETDAEGRFELSLLSKTVAEDLVELEVHLAGTPGLAPRVGTIPLPQELVEGTTTVGIVNLPAPSRRIVGRVMGADGAGIPSARILISEHTPPSDSGGAGGLRGLGYIGMDYRPLGDHVARTDAEGRFEVSLPGEDGRYTLQASKPGFEPSLQVPVEAGGDDLEIRLERGGAIVGSVLLPDPVDAFRFSIALVDENERSREIVDPGYGCESGAPDLGGHFRIRRVPAGRHTLRITLAYVDELLLEVRDVEVIPGEVTVDPRLQAIDLNDYVQVLGLSVVDVLDRPVPLGWIRLFPVKEETRCCRRMLFAGGKTRHLLMHGAYRAEIEAKGFRSTSVAEVRDGQRIVLEGGLPRRFVLPADLELPPEPWTLRLALHPPGGGKPTTPGPSAPGSLGGSSALQHTFGVEREFELALPEPGVWTVRWQVSRSAPRAFHHLPPTTVEIDDGTVLETIELAPDAAAYPSVLAKLR